MRLGISAGNFSWPIPTDEIGPKVAAIARAADEAGFDGFWAMDHFFQIAATGEPPESPLPEAYSVLNFIAGQTTRIRLGTLVTCAIYRQPGVLLKMVTSLDVLSGGRAIFGIGAGWNDEEARGLGLFFPSTAERFEHLEETLQIAELMWADDDRPFEGKHYQLARTLNSPNSLQRPRPPIMIGGGGEKKTLRLVAQYGDMCNLVAAPGPEGLDALRHKLDVLRAHCQDVGRDYDTIQKSVMVFVELGDDVDAGKGRLLERLGELAGIGISDVIFVRAGAFDVDSVEVLSSLVPAVADL
jgi:F420-dependent oxidoreductase-like protein